VTSSCVVGSTLDQMSNDEVNYFSSCYNLPMEQPPNSSENLPADEKPEKSFGSKKSNKLAKTFRAAALGAVLVGTSGDRMKEKETWTDMKERARQELKTEGVTSEQKSGNIPGVNHLINKTITPANYALNWHELREMALHNLREGRQQLRPEREDAWRLYLGLAQKHDTFGISDFKPTKSKEDKYYFKINSFPNHFDSAGIQKILSDIEFKKKYPNNKSPTFDFETAIMGEYSWSKGEDEQGPYISYYDKWDLSNPVEKIGIVGKPFEIYDRIYYDPQTFEKISP